MLDHDLIKQLSSLFLNLQSKITFLVSESNHEDQNDLLKLLQGVKSSSPMIEIRHHHERKDVPEFMILRNEVEVGISFKGIPTGHEFSSLVLSILHLDGKGKFPDETIIKRIKNLKGPMRIKTYVSLSCENCPEVVQTLNLMASLHEDFHHQMIDGSYVQEEVLSLGIQGVPSIVSEGVLLHSGRIDLLDLLLKLENHFGKNSADLNEAQDLGDYDVVIIGAGPAGSSSAIYCARKGLKTVVIADKIGGQVRDTKGIENFISLPYTEGKELSQKLAEHMSQYPIKIIEHRKVESVDDGVVKKIRLQSGEELRARSVIIASGAKWRELGIPGEKEYLGRGVAFCPHCDGPYFKGKKVAVIGGGNSGVEAAIDLSQLVKEVVLIEYASRLRADKVLVEKLMSLSNVTVITEAKALEIIGDGKRVEGIVLQMQKSQERRKVDLEGIFIQIGLIPNSQFLKGVIDMTSEGEIKIDHKCRTSKKGIYGAGDVTNVPYKQIVVAIGEGAKAGLSVFEDFIKEDIKK
jgi:alkyl hydroperoxide reductase subunit F